MNKAKITRVTRPYAQTYGSTTQTVFFTFDCPKCGQPFPEEYHSVGYRVNLIEEIEVQDPKTSEWLTKKEKIEDPLNNQLGKCKNCEQIFDIFIRPKSVTYELLKNECELCNKKGIQKPSITFVKLKNEKRHFPMCADCLKLAEQNETWSSIQNP